MRELDEAWRSVRLFGEDAIESDDVKVWIESQVGRNTLHDGDRAALQLGAAFGLTGASWHEGDARLQRALVEAQDAVIDGCGQLTQQLGIEAEPSAQLEGTGEDPLPQRYASGQHMVDHVGRALRHAPAQARRTEAAPFAAEGDHFHLRALLTNQQSGASAQHSTIEEALELLLDEVGQRCRGEAFLDGAVEGLEVVAND